MFDLFFKKLKISIIKRNLSPYEKKMKPNIYIYILMFK